MDSTFSTSMVGRGGKSKPRNIYFIKTNRCLFHDCCGLNDCVPPPPTQFVCLNLDPQGGGIRRLDLLGGDQVSYKRDLTELLRPLHHVRA